MSTDDNDPNNEPIEGRLRLTARELRGRAICKRRHGRATPTIRRWGGWGDLIRDGALAKKIDAFRAGQAPAEEVVWAFVRARVESHSPTFRWKGADLERLIRLVSECSESPHFEASKAEELAQELVVAQDAEWKSLKRLSEQFSHTFASIGKLPKAFAMPQLALYQAPIAPTLRALSRRQTFTVAEVLRAAREAAELAEGEGRREEAAMRPCERTSKS